MPDNQYPETAPHCDPSILHAPGSCQYCDMHPDWQRLRELWRINYSDTLDPDKAPCPSTRNRTTDVRDRWYGNRPYPPGTQPPSMLEWVTAATEAPAPRWRAHAADRIRRLLWGEP